MKTKNKYFMMSQILLCFLLIGCNRTMNKACLNDKTISSYTWDAQDTIQGIKINHKISSDFNKFAPIDRPVKTLKRINSYIVILTDKTILQINIKNKIIKTSDLPLNIYGLDLFICSDKVWVFGIDPLSKVYTLLNYNINDGMIKRSSIYDDILKSESSIKYFFDLSKEGIWINTSNNDLVFINLNDGSKNQKIRSGVELDQNSNFIISDTTLWTLNYKNKQAIVTKYDLGSEDIGNIYLEYPYDRFPLSLAVDKTNNLVINDIGYLDLNNIQYLDPGYNWSIFVRSQVFLLPSGWFEGKFRWIRPIISLIDSNNNYWYSGFGLVKYNPTSSEWCRYTYDDNYEVPIFEDLDHNIWTVFDGWLYNNNTDPTIK
jgi:hypothetical protein